MKNRLNVLISHFFISCLAISFVILSACSNDETKVEPSIEFLEGMWMSAQDTYGFWYFAENPDEKFYSAQVLRITKCETDCHMPGAYYSSFYRYKIEVGKVNEKSPDPLIANHMTNEPEYTETYYMNVVGHSELIKSVITRHMDTLSIININKDSLTFKENYLLDFRILYNTFKRTPEPKSVN
jgi:hypothetical protein